MWKRQCIDSIIINVYIMCVSSFKPSINFYFFIKIVSMMIFNDNWNKVIPIFKMHFYIK